MMRWLILFFLALTLNCFAKAEDWKAENEEEALFLRRIADFWEEGEYLIAKQQMEEFLEAFPESHFADPLYAALGDLFLREKNYSTALKYYANISAADFGESVFLNRMQCLYHLQWYATLAEECEKQLQKQLLEAEQKLQTTYFLAIALYQQCLNAVQNEEVLLQLAKRAEPYFEALFQSELSQEVSSAFAHLCCILKDYTKAANIYLDLAKQDPDKEEGLLFQAALIQAEYDRELASQSFRAISQKGGEKAKEAAYNRLVLSFEGNLFSELLEGREEWLRTIPEDRIPIAHFFFGKSLLSLKNYPEAIGELQAYVQKASPSDSFYAALLSLFEASYRAGNLTAFDEAVQQFQHHYETDPELPKTLFFRAQLLKKLEKREEAQNQIEKLLATFPDFPQKAQALFEATHLDYQAKSWDHCCAHARLFLSQYPDHELSPFVWRYLTSATAELSAKNPEVGEELTATLEELLKRKEKFSPQEVLDWEFLLAKNHFDRKHFKEAMSTLQPLVEKKMPNAFLLLALCYRDGLGDLSSFCSWAEKALQAHADLLDTGSLHSSLFNAYLERGNLTDAAEHLFHAFEAKAEIQRENLLWLVEIYFPQPEQNERCALLLEHLLHLKEDPLLFESVHYKLAKIYADLGKTEPQISLLEELLEQYLASASTPWQRENEARLLLAETYFAQGEEEKAASLFDSILADRSNVRSQPTASASLQCARLRIAKLTRENCPPSHPEWIPILSQLKDLVLQKAFQNEPLHLEAAIEYVELQNQLSPSSQKQLALWTKIKKDFEKTDDLLSKDYHQARAHFPQIDAIYRDYLAFMEAETLFAEKEKELQAKGKDLLLQIIDRKAHPALLARAKKRLEQVDAVEK